MRFTVCGEALIDLIGPEGGNRHESQWRALSGGGPMNTAVALARLGEDVSFLGRFGSDAFADQLRGHLTHAGVNLDLAVATDQATSLALVNVDDAGRASYTFHFNDTANFGWQPGDFAELTSCDWLHFGSIGAVVAPGAEALAGFIAATPARLSYDINIRPTVLTDADEYRRRVARLLTAVGASGGIAKASDEDIALLLGDPSADALAVAADWVRTYGLSAVVATLGPDGAVAVTRDGNIVRVPGHCVDLVDTVGAGDTFMAGFLSALAADGHDLEHALATGVAASAIVCTRQGADPPTAAEVSALFD